MRSGARCNRLVAAYNTGILAVSKSNFSGNGASNYCGDGGATYNTGTLTVSNSNFSGNSTLCKYTSGGGGILNAGELIVSNSTFSANLAPGGGGITNRGTSGTATVSNSSFIGNRSWYGSGGGGILNSGGTLSVGNSTFVSNGAADQGGGIHNLGGTVTVSNSTLAGNSATDEGGGGISNNSTMTLTNTIVANSPTGDNCVGAVTDGGGNLSYPDATCPGINSDPKLDPLQSNGGPTQTMALLPGSAAIDAANDAICAAAPINNRDQRGFTRPWGPHCDIGAFEAWPPMPPRAYLPIIMR